MFGLVVYAVYGPVLDAPFIYDDHNAIVDNRHVRRLWPIAEAVSAPAQSTVSGRPLVALSLALNHALGGYDVRGYHLVNLALHLANALLVFGLLARSFDLARRRHRTTDATHATDGARDPRDAGRAGQLNQPGDANDASRARAARTTALIAALIWLVHPLGTEAVAYVIQRTELLVSCFLLGSLYAATRGWTLTPPDASGAAPQRPGPDGLRRWHALAVTCCWLAVLSKEVAVAIPPLLLAWDAVLVSGSVRGALRRHRLLHAGAFASWLLLAWIVWSGPRSGTVGWHLGVSPLESLQTQAGVLLWYLRLALVPDALSIAYDWPILRDGAAALPALLAVATLLVTSSVAAARGRWWGLPGLWFFLILAPTSSVVPIVSEVAAERRMYLPLLALVFPLVLLGSVLLRRVVGAAPARRALGIGSAALVIGLLAVTARARVELYRRPVDIWSAAVEQRPESLTARVNLGRALADAGRADEARLQFEHARRAHPDDADLLTAMGMLLRETGRMEAAAEHFRAAAAADPRAAAARNNLGNVAAANEDWAAAERWYTEVLAIDPDHYRAHANLARALQATGRNDEAVAHLRRVVDLEPDLVTQRIALCRELLQRAQVDEVLEQLDADTLARARSSELYDLLGLARAERGEWAAAVKAFESGLALDPQRLELRQHLAQARSRAATGG